LNIRKNGVVCQEQRDLSGNPSVTSGKRPWEHVTQGPAAGALKNPAGLESPLGRKPDSSLRARLRPGRAHAPEGGPHGPAAALKG